MSTSNLFAVNMVVNQVNKLQSLNDEFTTFNNEINLLTSAEINNQSVLQQYIPFFTVNNINQLQSNFDALQTAINTSITNYQVALTNTNNSISQIQNNYSNVEPEIANISNTANQLSTIMATQINYMAANKRVFTEPVLSIGAVNTLSLNFNFNNVTLPQNASFYYITCYLSDSNNTPITTVMLPMASNVSLLPLTVTQNQNLSYIQCAFTDPTYSQWKITDSNNRPMISVTPTTITSYNLLVSSP